MDTPSAGRICVGWLRRVLCACMLHDRLRTRRGKLRFICAGDGCTPVRCRSTPLPRPSRQSVRAHGPGRGAHARWGGRRDVIPYLECDARLAPRLTPSWRRQRAEALRNTTAPTAPQPQAQIVESRRVWRGGRGDTDRERVSVRRRYTYTTRARARGRSDAGISRTHTRERGVTDM